MQLVLKCLNLNQFWLASMGLGEKPSYSCFHSLFIEWWTWAHMMWLTCSFRIVPHVVTGLAWTRNDANNMSNCHLIACFDNDDMYAWGPFFVWSEQKAWSEQNGMTRTEGIGFWAYAAGFQYVPWRFLYVPFEFMHDFSFPLYPSAHVMLLWCCHGTRSRILRIGLILLLICCRAIKCEISKDRVFKVWTAQMMLEWTRLIFPVQDLVVLHVLRDNPMYCRYFATVTHSSSGRGVSLKLYTATVTPFGRLKQCAVWMPRYIYIYIIH